MKTPIVIFILIFVGLWFFGADIMAEEPKAQDQVTKNAACSEPHEIETLLSGVKIDWGIPGCRYLVAKRISVFGKEGTVEFGFRSDEMIVWRFID